MLEALRPLEDAQWALRRLEATRDATEFRVLWTATVSLLRAVGHVLRNVDAEGDATTRIVVEDWWREVKSDASRHAIFWRFIERQRNEVLKEYRLGYLERLIAVATDGDSLELDSPIYKPLLDEQFNAEDARDVASDAVSWWNEQLLRIQTDIEARHRQSF